MPADQWLIVEKGIFKDYQTTREQVARIRKLTGVEPLARLFVRRVVESRAVPAHAEHLAAARRDATSASTTSSPPPTAASSSRIADRGRSTTSASTSSSPARRSTRSANGKIAGMLRDVAYQSNTPVFWNSMDMIGGPVVVLDGRIVQRRQGRAGAVELGQPRLRAGALQERHDPQHEAHRMIAPGSSAGRSRAAVARAGQKAIADRVLSFAAGRRPGAREHHERVGRQHALRGREHHDVRRRDQHIGDRHRHDRQAPRVGVDQRARRCVAEADGGAGGDAGEAVAGGSRADARARPADLRNGQRVRAAHRQPRSRSAGAAR